MVFLGCEKIGVFIYRENHTQSHWFITVSAPSKIKERFSGSVTEANGG